MPARIVSSRCTVGTLWTPMIHTWSPFDSVRFSTGGSFSDGTGPSAGGLERSGACWARTLVTPTRQRATRTRPQRDLRAFVTFVIKTVGTCTHLIGSTTNSTRLFSGSHFCAIAWMSAGDTAR